MTSPPFVPPRATRAFSRQRGGASELDAVAVEEPLEIRVQGRPVVVLLRTPGADEDLAAGFALTERIVSRAEDIDSVQICPATPAAAHGNVVDVILHPGAVARFEFHERPRYANSACGVCGVAALENLMRFTKVLEDARRVTAAVIQQGPALLAARQPAFQATGGLHAAGLVDDQDVLQVVREDVGRHNATDKVLGAWAMAKGAEPPKLLLVSSRAGFEIVEKALVQRVPILCSVGAPTSLAVETAQRGGLTLVAFVTGAGCAVYTHGQRVAWPQG